MPHKSPQPKSSRAALETFATACATFAAHVVSRLKPYPKHAEEIRLEAQAAVYGWVAWGPVRADGTARFADWKPGRALAALQARARRETLRRRRTKRRGRGVTLSLPGSRVVLDAPRSLWMFALDRCRRALVRLAGPVRPIVFDPAPYLVGAWDSTARAFAVHVAGAHARRTANTGNARHVAALRDAALTAVRDWVAKAAQRVARMLGAVPDLPAALVLRTKRAETAKVKAFAYWPASLLRAVRGALDLVPVVRVGIAQTVRASA